MVKRTDLWAHLTKLRLPATLLNSVKSIYDQDRYILIDGPKETQAVFPTVGVKQGCPLSPLLFSLFINDFHFEIGGDMGIKLSNNQIISHMFYADDLCLFTNNRDHMSMMLSKLEAYSTRKGLLINASKSCVLALHGDQSLPAPFKYGESDLEFVQEFKYLGMKFDRVGSMNHADAQMSRAFCGAIHNARDLAHKHGASKRLDLALLLYRVYAVPSALYGSQIWSTPFLHMDGIFNSLVQKRHLCYLRNLAHVRQGTPNWALLKEFGQKPFQYYWWRGIIKFWNNSVSHPENSLFYKTLKADVELATRFHNRDCWSSQVINAIKSFPTTSNFNHGTLLQKFKNLQPIDFACIEDGIMTAYKKVWSDLHEINGYRFDDAPHRKLLTYAKCYTNPDEVFTHCPNYLKGPYNTAISMARFRLGSHFLGVETDRWAPQHIAWNDRACHRCDTYSDDVKVDDEHHLIFDCEHFHNVRNPVAHITDSIDSVHDFFTSEDYESVPPFIAATMSLLDDCWKQSQATIPG